MPNICTAKYILLILNISIGLLEQSEPCLPMSQEHFPVAVSQIPASLQFLGQIHSEKKSFKMYEMINCFPEEIPLTRTVYSYISSVTNACSCQEITLTIAITWGATTRT